MAVNGLPRSRGRRLLVGLLTGLVPVGLTVTAIAVLFQAAPSRAVPYVTDEVAFWIQIASFEAVGMNGGYITVVVCCPWRSVRDRVRGV